MSETLIAGILVAIVILGALGMAVDIWLQPTE